MACRFRVLPTYLKRFFVQQTTQTQLLLKRRLKSQPVDPKGFFESVSHLLPLDPFVEVSFSLPNQYTEDKAGNVRSFPAPFHRACNVLSLSIRNTMCCPWTPAKTQLRIDGFRHSHWVFTCSKRNPKTVTTKLVHYQTNPQVLSKEQEIAKKTSLRDRGVPPPPSWDHSSARHAQRAGGKVGLMAPGHMPLDIPYLPKEHEALVPDPRPALAVPALVLDPDGGSLDPTGSGNRSRHQFFILIGHRNHNRKTS